MSLEPNHRRGEGCAGHSELMDGAERRLQRRPARPIMVRPGETLYRIGQKYHVAPINWCKWNNLKDNTVGCGPKLIVSQP